MATARLTLAEVAERLGVHYMTAYRYVRTGRLAGERVGATWWVDEDDVTAFAAPAQGTPPRRRSTPPHVRASRLCDRFVASDEVGAWQILEDAMSSGTPLDVLYDDLLATALVLLGEGWARGEISVAEEHRASVVATRVIGRLGPRFRRRGRSRGTVVLGAVYGDPHALPGALLADRVRSRGFEPLDLGANTPAVSFVETARDADRLVAVMVGATTSGYEKALEETVATLRRGDVTVPILLGGRGVRDEATALRLGATGFSGYDARRALETLDVLVHAT